VVALLMMPAAISLTCRETLFHMLRFLTRGLTVSALILSGLAFEAHSKAVLEFSEEQSKTAIDILAKLSERHYRDQKVDDELSSMVLDKFVLSLDPSKSFFLRSDLEEFEVYRTQLDERFLAGDLTPGQAIFSRYFERASKRLNDVIDQLEGAPLTFDFNKDEFIEISADDQAWAKGKSEADGRWRKRLKANLLSLKLADEPLDKAQETLLKRYRNQLKRLEQQGADDVFEGMINALTLLYDPHTSYLSPKTLENFNISMSLSLEGIGAVLQAEDEFTKVVRLITAGPADKQGELRPADKIVAVGQGPAGDYVDVVGWRLDEVVKLIRGPANTVVRLSIIPATAADNSDRREIKIQRGKVKLEEQAAKKAIVELTDGEQLFKIGVINVPAFYIDFEAYRRRDPDFKSTTRDVYRLLKELEQENIDGLIVDLRNNGGGSLQEATTLTDLFIDQGPVVQIRQTNETISRNYRSRQRAVYRGPMIVLTNRLSASASEIFAGAIQDYKRGLIVGAQSFGKGTVQSLTPVHSGQLKITESKFYRVSGDSTQHRGVLPDISFPFLVDAMDVGESSYEHALPWDQIHPVPHDYYFSFEKILSEVKALHEVRKEKDPDFIFLESQVARLAETRAKTRISLNETHRKQEKDEFEADSLRLENTRRTAKGLEPLESMIVWREEQEEKTAEARKPTAEIDTDNDTLLSESAYILIDMINLLQKESANKLANF